MKVFICYRRDDSQHIVDRIYDRLVEEFGENNVFKDVMNILPGTKFPNKIQEEVGKCDCLLVVIGAQWLKLRNKSGIPKLEDPRDSVCIEIESALARKTPIIPLLVDDAEMPPPDQLPERIRGLLDYNGVPVRPDPDFKHDIERITNALHLLGTSENPSRPKAKTNGTRGMGCLFLAILVVLAMLYLLTIPVTDVSDLSVKPSGSGSSEGPITPSSTDEFEKLKQVFATADIQLHGAQDPSDKSNDDQWWRHYLWLDIPDDLTQHIALVTYYNSEFATVTLPIEEFVKRDEQHRDGELPHQTEGDYKYSGDKGGKFNVHYYGQGAVTVDITLYSSDGRILRTLSEVTADSYPEIEKEDENYEFLWQ